MSADDTSILLVIESYDGTLRQGSFEGFSIGRELADSAGGKLIALAVGSGIADSAASLGAYGADQVLVADAAELAAVTVDGYAKAVTAAIDQVEPAVVLLGGTTGGRDVASYLSGKLDAPHLADCYSLRIEGDTVEATRPVHGNKLMTTVTTSREKLVFASLHSNAFAVPEADGSRTADVSNLDISFDESEMRVKVTALESSSAGDTDIATAEIVVIGGRGLGSEENYKLVQDLAEAFGGSAGATRAVTDLGWRPHYEQVGQTGHKISPKLYVGVGVSGAVQHTVGMTGSENIVAINRDPDAPIFKLADFGLVGDLVEIVPKLTEAIKAKKG